MQVITLSPQFSVAPQKSLSMGPSQMVEARFGKNKGTTSAEDSMARGFLALFSLIGGGIVLAGLGVGKFWHSHSMFGMGGAQRTMQQSVDQFQASRGLPSQGKVEFRQMLERAQEQVVDNTDAQSVTQQIKTLVPDLTQDELKTLDQLRADSQNVTQAKDLMPLFSKWVDILDKHSEKPLDKAQITADAQAYFSGLKTHNNIQWGFTAALVAVAVLAGLGLREGFKA